MEPPETPGRFSQAQNWIYPKIGARKLRDFTATEDDDFFKELGQVFSKRTLVMIKSTLRRSIRRAQVHNLIARNVVELIDLPSGQPGRPSRAMTQSQASKVLKAAAGQASGISGMTASLAAARMSGDHPV